MKEELVGLCERRWQQSKGKDAAVLATLFD